MAQGGNKITETQYSYVEAASQDPIVQAEDRTFEAAKHYDRGNVGSAVRSLGLGFAVLGGLAFSCTVMATPLLPVEAIVGAAALAGGLTSFGVGVHTRRRAKNNLEAAQLNRETVLCGKQWVDEKRWIERQHALGLA